MYMYMYTYMYRELYWLVWWDKNGSTVTLSGSANKHHPPPFSCSLSPLPRPSLRRLLSGTTLFGTLARQLASTVGV